MDTRWVVVLLSVALLCATVLCALGVMGTSELLPLLGGVVVVAHRMLEPIKAKALPDVKFPSKPPSLPPGSSVGGVGVVIGMAAGAVASSAASLGGF